MAKRKLLMPFCPDCGTRLDLGACEEVMLDYRPRKDDLAVCEVCIAPLMFVNQKQLRVLLADDLAALDACDQDLLARAQIDIARLAVKH